MNQTPAGERVHIGIFGRCNAGKSSVLNAVTGQSLAVVSPVEGTTTDPVYKAMELLPLGPVLFMDTPGLDDRSLLGALRTEKTGEILRKTEIALLVLDLTAEGNRKEEIWLLREVLQRRIPCLLIWNKSDLIGKEAAEERIVRRRKEFQKKLGLAENGLPEGIVMSAGSGEGAKVLKEKLAVLIPEKKEPSICQDLFFPGDTVVLVIPLDQAAPKGRLILPQQQVIRDILEGGGIPVLTSVERLKSTLENLKAKPALVITDSQAFAPVEKAVPEDVLLTSFSILFARYKGNFIQLLSGTAKLAGIRSGDKVLIAEGCTHHRQCGDIGTEKLPAWIRKTVQGEPDFVFCSGTGFPEALEDYRVILHCGGCMLNQAEMGWRLEAAERAGVPVSNYGMAIAWLLGILPRALEPFPGARKLWMAMTREGCHE